MYYQGVNFSLNIKNSQVTLPIEKTMLKKKWMDKKYTLKHLTVLIIKS